MKAALLVSVRFHDGRYHGTGHWPPSPARLFQALVSAAARGAELSAASIGALAWLENLSAPDIIAPVSTRGQRYNNFVPNNDLDAKGGDPSRIADIRVIKVIHPHLFDQSVPVSYVWRFSHEKGSLQWARGVAQIALRLYQLGRGGDMAWAQAEVLDEEELGQKLNGLEGRRHTPTPDGSGQQLDCPSPGTLRSLSSRFGAQLLRLRTSTVGSTSQVRFVQAPKARVRTIAYDSLPSRVIFELRSTEASSPFAPRRLRTAAALTAMLRDAAIERLSAAMPQQAAIVEQVLRAKVPGARGRLPRTRVIPLPSVGHAHADHLLRRILIEVPSDSPVSAADLSWAFSGIGLSSGETRSNEGAGATDCLVRASDLSSLRHFGIGGEPSVRSCRWRTLTPVVLPESAARRRIDPDRIGEEWKGGAERAHEHGAAISAVRTALRHAGVANRVSSVRVQREPFTKNGERAEAFANGTRFAKERLWHAEVTFQDSAPGPIVIGDGRYAGLGVMAPVRVSERTTCFASWSIANGLLDDAEPSIVARALRRAVMARVQQHLGASATLPRIFSGHEPDGAPSRAEHSHLAFVADLARSRLLVLPPHMLGKFNAEAGSFPRKHMNTLQSAVEGMGLLRAGQAGRLTLTPLSIEEQDPILGQSRIWESTTDYEPTRHWKRVEPAEAIRIDVMSELQRCKFPTAEIDVLSVRKGPRRGLRGRVRLTFANAVPGPIMLGRTLHFGGGLFAAASPQH